MAVIYPNWADNRSFMRVICKLWERLKNVRSKIKTNEN